MKKVTFEFPVSNRYEYYVTCNGQVFKTDNRNGKMEECFYHIARGYKRIRITDVSCNIRRYVRVGRLVATYFCENSNPQEFNVVDHKDGNKLNDTYTNLEWCSISTNTKRAYDNGLVKDRGGWTAHPYKDRIKLYANTEG